MPIILPNLEQLVFQRRKEDYLKEILLINDSILWKEICEALYEDSFYWGTNSSKNINKKEFPECWKNMIGKTRNSEKVYLYITPSVIEITIGCNNYINKSFLREYNSEKTFLEMYSKSSEYVYYLHSEYEE